MLPLLQVIIDPATGNGSTIGTRFPNPGALLSVVLRNSLTVIGIILLILLISGGITYIMGASNNDPKKTAQAQAILTDALIGFAVVFLAFFIIQIIQVLTGLEILNPTI